MFMLSDQSSSQILFYFFPTYNFSMGSVPNTDNKPNQKKGNFYKFQPMSRDSKLPKQQLQIQNSDKQPILNIMQTHCSFSFLPQQAKQKCIKHFTKWIYYKQHYVYRQHDPADKLCFINKGVMSVQIDCNPTKKLQKNEYFGHDSLCFQCPRGESVRVYSAASILYQIRKQDVLDILKQNMQNFRQDIRNVFSYIHFFNYLTNKQKELLIQNTFLFKLKNGENLFQEDQEANSFYIIRKGSITISIHKKKAIHLKENEYFGESSFLKLVKNKKSQRMGRAFANAEGAEVYGIGLVQIKKKLGNQFRSILFFNHLKWTLFRDQYLNSLQRVNYSQLLQLFNVKKGGRFEILVKKGEIPKHLLIPLQTEINFDKDLKLYCVEYLVESYTKPLANDIILTEGGYYAYVMIQQFKKILDFDSKQSGKQLDKKLLNQPIYKNLTLTLKNINKYSKMILSSPYTTVLIVQDMKFGNQFIIKIYNKKPKLSKQSQTNSKNENICQLAYSNPKSYKIINKQQILANFMHSAQTPKTQKKQLVKQNNLFLQEKLIRREKQLLAQINSKYVCGYYKAQQDQHHYYIFLEYISGNKLTQIINYFGIVPENIIKYILASIASAIDQLHFNNVIYRNLNSTDIIISHKGLIVFTDLSCSKKLARQQKTRTVIGLPHYMAPQMIQGKDYSYSVDIWSMGVVLYEIFTGKLPFAQEIMNPFEIYQQILSKPLDLSKIGNKKAKQLISCLLQKDTNLRVQKPLQIRKFSYMSDSQFQWDLFLSQQMNPAYFPQQKSFKYLNIQNQLIFDAINIEEWK